MGHDPSVNYRHGTIRHVAEKPGRLESQNNRFSIWQVCRGERNAIAESDLGCGLRFPT